MVHEWCQHAAWLNFACAPQSVLVHVGAGVLAQQTDSRPVYRKVHHKFACTDVQRRRVGTCCGDQQALCKTLQKARAQFTVLHIGSLDYCRPPAAF